MNISTNLPKNFTDELFKKGLFEQCDAVFTADFNESDADNLLRHGSIKGCLLRHREAEVLICKALEIFEKESIQEKTAECLNELANVFQRSGELAKAKIYLKRAKKIKNNYSLIVEQIILLDEKCFAEVIKLMPIQDTDFYITANYHNNLGRAYFELGNLTAAIENYEFAKELFDLCEHSNYSASAENNLALCYLRQKEFTKAHIKADNAVSIHLKNENFARLASTYDTKATIYFAEKNTLKALELIDKSIDLLKTHEHIFYLLDSYATKIKILSGLRKSEELLHIFGQAYSLAFARCGQTWTDKYVRSIGQMLFSEQYTENSCILEIEDMGNKYLSFSEDFQNSSNLFCARTLRDEVQNFGELSGSIVVISDQMPEPGELTAILEKNTNLVEIGIMKTITGLTVLECSNGTTKIFGNEFRVLGKVIGVGTENGKFINVELL